MTIYLIQKIDSTYDGQTKRDERTDRQKKNPPKTAERIDRQTKNPPKTAQTNEKSSQNGVHKIV